MNILKVCGAAFIAVICAAVTDQLRPGTSKLISASCGIVIALFIINGIVPVVEYLSSLDTEGDYPYYLRMMLKGAGTALICESVSDVCSDCGKSSLASKVELAGKIQLLVFSLPLIKDIISAGMSFLT